MTARPLLRYCELIPAHPLNHDITFLTTHLHLHLTPHTCVALHSLPSHVALPLALSLRAVNVVPVWLNARWSTSELLRALVSVPVSALLTSAPPPPALSAVVPASFTIIRTPTSTPFTITSLSPTPDPSLQASLTTADLPPRTAAVFFTSGTTSDPKPVPLTHENLYVQSRAKITHIPYTHKTTLLNLAPLYHLGGFSSSHAAFLTNATIIFPPALPRQQPQAARALLAYIRATAANALVVVPATLQQLADAKAQPCPTVATILYGGNPVSRALRASTAMVFPNAHLVGAYGMTETASSMTFLHHARLPINSPLHASIGTCPPHVQLRILDASHPTRVAVRTRVVGELVTRGPHVMPGYLSAWRTRGDFTEDGWFRTGDVGTVDEDGIFFLMGRCKDMIKSGGENVFAGEVEDALVRHPNVREAAVVGIPHRVLGEAVAAAVVLSNEASEGVLSHLREICRDCLSPFKRPKWIVQQPALPRNATGKVLKYQVRDRLEQQICPRLARL